MSEFTAVEVVQGLRSDPRETVLALYDTYSRRVWLEAARLMGGRAEEVADVVQETFLAAIQSAHTFDSRRGTVWGWLAAIARQRAALHYRKHCPKESMRKAVAWWVSLNGSRRERGDLPADALEQRELSVLVRQALAQISDEYRSMLISRYMDRVSTTILAGEAGISQEAYRSKLARARRAFSDAFRRLTENEPQGVYP